MLSKQHHWLEIAEYLAIALTAIGLVVAIASGVLLFSIICLFIALILNLINRLRFQSLSRKRLAANLKQLQNQFNEHLQVIAARAAQQPPPPTPPPTLAAPINANVISIVQENLVSVERSLNSVVQYLNRQTLPDRIEQLEQSYKQLQQQITSLGEQLGQVTETSSPRAELSPVVSPPPPSAPTPRGTSAIVSNWRQFYTINAHREAVSSLTISRDRRFLASVGWDRELKLWDMATGNQIPHDPVGHSQGILAVVFTQEETESDRYHLATGSFDRTIKLWSFVVEDSDRGNLHLEKTLTEHTGSIHALAIAPVKGILVSGSFDQTVKQWNVQTGELLKSSQDNSGVIYAIAVNELTQLIACAGGDGRIFLWELETGEKLGWLGGNVSSVESLAISPNGQTLAAGCTDGTIKIWQLEASLDRSDRHPQPIKVLHARAQQIKALVFDRDGQTLFSGGADGAIEIWHYNSTQAMEILTRSDESTASSPIYAMTLSSSDRLLAVGSADGNITLWERD
jgi:WD40 repeat protein